MTFRAKPAVKRTHRPSWETRDRRNLLINLAFVGVIAFALLILLAAAGVSYYGDHFTSVANVNGISITKDQLRDRTKVDAWRLDHKESVVRDQLNTGKITQDQASSQLQQLTSLRNQLPQSSLDKLVDATLQGQLATRQGLAPVTSEQIDAQLTKEATAPELRHVWEISIAPEVSAGTTGPTDAEKAAAKAKADQALADIKAGKKWEDVAKSVSADSTGGDLGWQTKTGGQDQTFQDALFALQLNGVTDVVTGGDGTYRIGRVTEIQPSAVDAEYQQKISDAGVPMSAYRDAVKADIVQQELSDKVTADAVGTPSPMRHVSEIFLRGAPSTTPVDEVKSSHILISPKGDPSAAQSLPATDPAWKTAEDTANQIYDELKADPSKFAELAKTKSDDKSSGANGGELGWIKEADVVPAFGSAIFAPGLTPGEILAPVKSEFGYHIIRFEQRRPDASIRIKQIHDEALKPGADFAALAKANSDGAEAAQGGDLGWVARNQIDKAQEDAIFAAPVGKVSDILTTASGYYIFDVSEEQTRKPEGAQLATLQSSAFTNWYAAQKQAATVTEDTLSASP